jgi:hypothetical protein
MGMPHLHHAPLKDSLLFNIFLIIFFFFGGGRLLQVDTVTAERYSPHWMNWMDYSIQSVAPRWLVLAVGSVVIGKDSVTNCSLP